MAIPFRIRQSIYVTINLQQKRFETLYLCKKTTLFTKVVSKLLLGMTEIGCLQHKVQNGEENYIWHKKVNTELFLFPINVKLQKVRGEKLLYSNWYLRMKLTLWAHIQISASLSIKMNKSQLTQTTWGIKMSVYA